MAEDYDTMTTDDTEVMAQAPAPDADAIAIPLVLVAPSLTSTISGRLCPTFSYTILDPTSIWRYWGGFCFRSFLAACCVWQHLYYLLVGIMSCYDTARDPLGQFYFGP